MPINPNILLGGRPPQINDPLQTANQMISLRQMMEEAPIRQQIQRNQLRATELGFQDRERDLKRESEFLEGIKAGKSSTDLMSVDPARAMSMRKHEAELGKTNLEQEKARLELFKGRAERLSSIGAGISDQVSYVNGIHQAVREGLIPAADAMKLPGKYDPALVQQFVRSALSAKDKHELDLRDLEEKRKAELHPSAVAKATADAQHASQVVEGKVPITAYQQAQLDRASLPNTPTELAVVAADPNRSPEERANASAALERLNEYQKAGRPVMSGGGGSDLSATVQAVMANPSLYNDLTPSVKTRIAPDLAKAGFTGFGAGRPTTGAQKAMVSLTEFRGSLNDYRKTLESLGPKLLPGNPEYGTLQTKFTDMQMKLKNLYELGAITGPDMTLLNNAITDPTGIRGNYAGKATLLSQLDAFKDILDRAETSLKTVYQGGSPAAATSTVRMIAPNGQVKEVPVDQVGHYESMGAKRAK